MPSRADAAAAKARYDEGEALVDDPPTYCKPEDRYHNCYDPDTNTYSPGDWRRRTASHNEIK